MEAYKEPGEIEKVFRCVGCYEEYETAREAKNCHAEWLCGWCGEPYETKKEANQCCKEE
jgi:hypothetical protein